MLDPRVLDIAEDTVSEMLSTVDVDAEPGSVSPSRFFAYQGREKEFIRDQLGRKHPESGDLAYPESSEYLVDALFRHRFVVVRSPRKFSKTFTAADLIITVFATRPSVVIPFGPTFRQLQNNLWAQVLRTYDRCPHLPGERLATTIRCGPMHYIEPISTNSPDRAAGYHGDTPMPPDTFNRDPEEGEIERIIEEAREKLRQGQLAAAASGSILFIVLEECFGIPAAIIDALEGSMQGPNVMVLAIGNPTKSPADSHPAVRWCIDDSSPFHRIKFSHLSEELYPDTVPADKVFDRGYGAEWEVGSKRAGKYGLSSFIADHKWVENKEREWGAESSLFKSQVLGQMAGSDHTDQVIPPEIIAAAYGECKCPALGAHIGVDISAGGDLCVMYLALDGKGLAVHSWRPNRGDPMVMGSVAKRIFDVVKGWSTQLLAAGQIEEEIPGSHVHIDVGFERTVCELLRGMGLWPDAVNFGASPRYLWRSLHGGTLFLNLRAEMHWSLRCGLRERVFEIPNTDAFREVREQAQWPTYRMVDGTDGRAVVVIEDKKLIKKRHGASTDFLDAALLAYLGTGQSSTPNVW